MSRAAIARSVALVVTAVVLAGCTQVVGGQAAGDPRVLREISERNRPLSSQQALGDYATIDYCSLLNGVKPSANGRFSPPPDASFEYCGYFFERGDNLTYVALGYLGDQETTAGDSGSPVDDLDLPHQLEASRLQRSEPCSYGLTFPDGVRLEIWARGDGLAMRRQCELARAALDGAVDVLTNDGVRHYEYPAGSFGRLDTCSGTDPVLRTEHVAGELGTRLNLWQWPNEHACTWTAGSGESDAVYLYFLTYFPGVLGDIGSAERIGGRPTRVEELGSSCRALTPHIPNDYMYEERVGDTMVEVAAIEVADSATADSCDTARTLAESAWPKLPDS